ncbi:hypothetical protein U1Q18_028062 [Sarracenia purpurea var. burkii]
MRRRNRRGDVNSEEIEERWCHGGPSVARGSFCRIYRRFRKTAKGVGEDHGAQRRSSRRSCKSVQAVDCSSFSLSANHSVERRLIGGLGHASDKSGEEGGGVASLAGSATGDDLEFFRSPVNGRKRRRKESREHRRGMLLSFTSGVIPVQQRREAAEVAGVLGEESGEIAHWKQYFR